jgi:hypothetical protein
LVIHSDKVFGLQSSKLLHLAPIEANVWTT